MIFLRSKFVGYDSLETKSKVVKYRKVSGKGNQLYQVVLDKPSMPKAADRWATAAINHQPGNR